MTVWQRLEAKSADRRWWSWTDVLVPWSVTRLLLVFIAWFSGYFVANPAYGDLVAVARGWQYSPVKLLDVWGRWDSSWYLVAGCMRGCLTGLGVSLALVAVCARHDVRQDAGMAPPHYGPLYRRPPPSFS